jgi:hypothetical protein
VEAKLLPLSITPEGLNKQYMGKVIAVCSTTPWTHIEDMDAKLHTVFSALDVGM